MLKNKCVTFDKKKYVLHYKNLKLYSRLGLKLRKMCCVSASNHLQWSESYIEFNTHQRTEAEKIETKMEKRCTY